MYKARFTKAGAVRMGVPHLAGKKFEYDNIKAAPYNTVVNNIYYNGERLGSALPFVGKDRGRDLITKP